MCALNDVARTTSSFLFRYTALKVKISAAILPTWLDCLGIELEQNVTAVEWAPAITVRPRGARENVNVTRCLSVQGEEDPLCRSPEEMAGDRAEETRSFVVVAP